jgi:hypothetical protein
MEVTALPAEYEIEWIPELVRHNEGEINPSFWLDIQ